MSLPKPPEHTTLTIDAISANSIRVSLYEAYDRYGVAREEEIVFVGDAAPRSRIEIDVHAAVSAVIYRYQRQIELGTIIRGLQ